MILPQLGQFLFTLDTVTSGSLVLVAFMNIGQIAYLLACGFPGVQRIIECFGLERTFKGHLAQPPCSEQGHLQPDQVAQSSIQPDLERFQAQGLHYLSGQLVPVFHHPHCKKCLPYI